MNYMPLVNIDRRWQSTDKHFTFFEGVHYVSRVKCSQQVASIGTAKEKASVLSFVLDGYSTEQVGKHLAVMGLPFAPDTTVHNPFCGILAWSRLYVQRWHCIILQVK